MNFLHRILDPEGLGVEPSASEAPPQPTATTTDPAVPQEEDEEESEESTAGESLKEDMGAAMVPRPEPTQPPLSSPMRGLGQAGGENGNFSYPMLETGEVSG